MTGSADHNSFFEAAARDLERDVAVFQQQMLALVTAKIDRAACTYQPSARAICLSTASKIAIHTAGLSSARQRRDAKVARP